MKATDINNKGKKEKGQKVKAGDCIFPFKYQWKDHKECFKTEKGDICATSITDRGTLKTYGYCEKQPSKSPLKITCPFAFNISKFAFLVAPSISMINSFEKII